MSLSPSSTVPFVGVLVQLGGAALLVGFFVLLRRYVFRRDYFSAWVVAWGCVALGAAALSIRYMLAEGGAAASDDLPAVRTLYFVYQAARLVALIYFLR